MTEKPVALPSQLSKHVDAGLGDSADVTIYSGGAKETDVNYTTNSVDGPVAQLGRRQVALPSTPSPTCRICGQPPECVWHLPHHAYQRAEDATKLGESVPSTPSPNQSDDFIKRADEWMYEYFKEQGPWFTHDVHCPEDLEEKDFCSTQVACYAAWFAAKLGAPATSSPTYEYLLEMMRDYAKAQQKCGNPVRLEDLREFRRWKNMPQDKARDAALIAESAVPSTPSPIYEQALEQQKCGNPGRLEDLKEFQANQSPLHNHQNILDCGLGCPAWTSADWTQRGVPATSSPTICKHCEETRVKRILDPNAPAGICHACGSAIELGVPSTPVETQE